jgi:ATP-dependent 26S proteasome regulatory subunit
VEEFVMAKDELSGADIKALCTEAGLPALFSLDCLLIDHPPP